MTMKRAGEKSPARFIYLYRRNLTLPRFCVQAVKQEPTRQSRLYPFRGRHGARTPPG